MIHHTAGVHPNGEWKTNGVSCENLATHIKYNLTYRPGRALFVDGVCVYSGAVGPETIKAFEQKLMGATAEKDTAPYV